MGGFDNQQRNYGVQNEREPQPQSLFAHHDFYEEDLSDLPFCREKSRSPFRDPTLQGGQPHQHQLLQQQPNHGSKYHQLCQRRPTPHDSLDMSFKSAEGANVDDGPLAHIPPSADEPDNSANGFLLNYLGINNGNGTGTFDVPMKQPRNANGVVGTSGFNLQRTVTGIGAPVTAPTGAAGAITAPVGRIP